MSATFLARPITDASAEELAWAHELRAWLVAHGAGVRFGGDTDATSPREVADSNVAAIVSARALVAILPRRLDVLSSVWVEIGIAIGAGVPVALVRPGVGDIETISVPFLIDGPAGGVRSMGGRPRWDEPVTGGAECARLVAAHRQPLKSDVRQAGNPRDGLWSVTQAEAK